MNPYLKSSLIIASVIAALLYGAPEDFWTKVAGGVIVVAVSIVMNYWLTSNTARVKVAEEMGAYKQELASLRKAVDEQKTAMTDQSATLKDVLQELGTVQGELKQISRRR